jgi:hypothetical protein
MIHAPVVTPVTGREGVAHLIVRAPFLSDFLFLTTNQRFRTIRNLLRVMGLPTTTVESLVPTDDYRVFLASIGVLSGCLTELMLLDGREEIHDAVSVKAMATMEVRVGRLELRTQFSCVWMELDYSEEDGFYEAAKVRTF